MASKNVRAIATSRCEVSGRVYLPGDPMLVTQEQFDFLEQEKAARREVLQSATPPTVNPTDAEESDLRYFRRVGKPRPKRKGV